MPVSIIAMGLAAGACLGGATAALLHVAGPERILYAMILGGTALQFLVWTVLSHVIRGPESGPLPWSEVAGALGPETPALTKPRLEVPAA